MGRDLDLPKKPGRKSLSEFKNAQGQNKASRLSLERGGEVKGGRGNQTRIMREGILKE